MTWDYNIGLVRTTHLFQCCNHPKVGHLTDLCIHAILTVPFFLDDSWEGVESKSWLA